jgi:hypothetical protein
MIRARFTVSAEDYRPVVWPIKHPYWCSGYHGDDSGAILVAYADSIEQIKELWPDATNIDVMEAPDQYTFTDRFPKPDWLEAAPT